MVGDILAGAFGLLISLYFWGQADWLNFSWDFLSQRIPVWYYLLPLLWVIFLVDMYDMRRATHLKETFKGVSTTAALALALYLVVFFISDTNSLPRKGIAVFIFAATAFTFLWRFLYIRVFTAPGFVRRALVVGAGNAGTAFCRAYNEMQLPSLNITGYIDDDPLKSQATIEGLPVLGKGDDLLNVIDKYQITDLIFAISGELNPELFRTLLLATEKGVEITSVPTLYEELFGRVPIFILQSDWILRSFIDQMRTTGFYESTKRLIDVFVSILGCIALVITFPFVALAILIDSGTPIFFTQNRVGINGTTFKILKYRTMIQGAQRFGQPRATLDHDQRITRFGKLLRMTHFDELPQVFNILKGEMSIVGPRSEQQTLVNLYQQSIPFYRARFFVRPGLTGWAQINQRYASNTSENAVKLEYDLYYIKHRSLTLDFTIILRTVGAVVGFRGQ